MFRVLEVKSCQWFSASATPIVILSSFVPRFDNGRLGQLVGKALRGI